MVEKYRKFQFFSSFAQKLEHVEFMPNCRKILEFSVDGQTLRYIEKKCIVGQRESENVKVSGNIKPVYKSLLRSTLGLPSSGETAWL